MTDRPGDWMQTFTGRRFWPLDPRPSEICIEDIAHALARQCRYGGHCLRFYSVAEHSVLLAGWIGARHSPPVALAALLHDAAEAYVVDVPRPLKRHLGGYKAIEDHILRAVFEALAFGDVVPRAVKAADDRILADERAQNLVHVSWDHEPGPALGVSLQFWSPDEAERRFLDAYERLRRAS